jgi:membrane-associated phospholipid phosphatase
MALVGLGLLALGCASVFLLDQRLAGAIQNAWPQRPIAVQRFSNAVETVFLFRVSIFASGLLVLAAAGVFRIAGRRSMALTLAFIAAAQLTTRFVVDVTKPMFDRLRPFETLGADGIVHDRFFADVGNAFPSGHAAHVWGFYFALALAFPRWRVPLLLLPVLVSGARVIVNDHFVGDVVASAAIAALVTTGWAAGIYGAAGRSERMSS